MTVRAPASEAPPRDGRFLPWVASRPETIEMLAEAERTAWALDLADVRARIERCRAKRRRAGAGPTNVLKRKGDVWLVRVGGTALRVKDARGLHYLAALVAAPGRELRVLQLAGVGRAAASATGGGDGLPIDVFGVPLDDTPDARARRASAARLGEPRSELEEAERFGDLGRAELPPDAGAPGAAPASTAPRKRRGRPSKALRTQIGRLLAPDPLLGRHLRDAVRMGTSASTRRPIASTGTPDGADAASA